MDIKINPDVLDLSVINGSIEKDESLITPCLVSIFTERRLKPEEQSIVDGSRSGWFGCHIEGVEIGSLLWTLRRAKKDDETLNMAIDYLNDCLGWMKENLVRDIEIEAEWSGDVLVPTIKMYKKDGTALTVKFSYIWQNTEVES